MCLNKIHTDQFKKKKKVNLIKYKLASMIQGVGGLLFIGWKRN